MKNTTNTPKIGNWLFLLIRVGAFIRLKWVDIFLCGASFPGKLWWFLVAMLATIGVTMFLLLRKTERLINYKTIYLPSVFHVCLAGTSNSIYIDIISMRGSRKFCQRGSNFDNVFIVDEGRDNPKYHYKRAIIDPPAKCH